MKAGRMQDLPRLPEVTTSWQGAERLLWASEGQDSYYLHHLCMNPSLYVCPTVYGQRTAAQAVMGCFTGTVWGPGWGEVISVP